MASWSWRWNRSGGRDRANEYEERSGGALLAGVAVGRVHDVAHGEVEIGGWGDDDGVLAAGLGEEPQVGPEGVEQLRGLVGAGEDHLVDRRVGDELGAEGALVDLDERDEFGGGIGGGERVAHDPGEHRAASFGWSGWLEDDGGPGGERGERGPGGDGDRKVPRGRDEREGGGDERGAVDVVESQGFFGVEVGEVDGFGDFWVGLVEGLARFADHDLDEVAPAGFECVTDGVQDPGAFVGGAFGPTVRPQRERR